MTLADSQRAPSGTPRTARFVQMRQAWLAGRSARLEPVRTTHSPARSVCEALLHLHAIRRFRPTAQAA